MSGSSTPGSHHYTYPRLYKNNSNSRKQDGLLGGRAGQDDQGVTVQDGQLEHAGDVLEEDYKDTEAVRLRALFRIILRFVRHNIFGNFSERSLKLEITFKRREDPKTRNDVKCSGKK